MQGHNLPVKVPLKARKVCKFKWVNLTPHSRICLATLMTPCARETVTLIVIVAGDMTCGNDIVKTKLLHPSYILIKM